MNARRVGLPLLALVLVASACSSGDGDDASATTDPETAVTTATPDECRQVIAAAVGRFQDVVDRYADVTVEQWNGGEVEQPDFAALQKRLQADAEAAVKRGCAVQLLQDTLKSELDGLKGDGQVGTALAAALRGEPATVAVPAPPAAAPPSNATRVVRDAGASNAALGSGDDLQSVLARVGPGSTVRLGAGTYRLTQPVVLDADVTIVGAGRDRTVIESSAPGLAIAFTGPGGLAVRDLTLRHVGGSEASVLLAIEGPVTLSGVSITGAVSGGEQSPGGHGVVIAFQAIPGFPSRTAEERAGPVVIESSDISGNQAGGIVVTGDAAPEIRGSTVSRNGACGICLGGTAGGRVVESTVQGNRIGMQLGVAATPVVERTWISGNPGAGVTIDGAAAPQLRGNTIEGSEGIGIQVTGTAAPVIEDNRVSGHGVGVLATEASRLRVARNRFTGNRVGVQAGGLVAMETAENEIRDSQALGVAYGGVSSGTIRDNVIVAAHTAAIQVHEQAAPLVRGNRVTGAGSVGISYLGSAKGTAAGNEIIGREIGIQVGASAAPEIARNTVRDSKSAGLLYAADAAGVARENTITGSAKVGIIAGGNARPEVSANHIADGAVAIVFRERSSGSVTRNEIVRQTIGVQVVDRATPAFDRNTITDSKEAAAAYAGSAGGTFSRNDLARNGAIGIQIAGSAAPTISDNTIRGRSVYALLYRDKAAGTAARNLLVDHVFGVQVGGTSTPRLLDNTFDEVVLTNIVYTDSSGGEARGNQCETTLSVGISVTAPADPVLADNDCTVSRSD